MDNTTEHQTDPSCCLCGSKNLKQIQKELCAEDGSSYDILECASCRMGVIHPKLSSEVLSSFYPEDYYSYVEMSDKEKDPIGIYERVSRFIRTKTYQAHYLPIAKKNIPLHQKLWMKGLSFFGGFRFGFPLPPQNGGRILDVGCGNGFFLQAVKDIGWEVHGIEINKNAINQAVASGIENAVQGTFDAASYPDQYFDVIRFWSVLEHLQSPAETLVKARRLLKPGGLLVLQVPNYKSAAARWSGCRWSAWDVPRHLYHFSPRALKTLLDKVGFTLTRWGTCSVGTLPASIVKHPGLRHRIAGVFLDKILDWLNRGDCLVVYATPKEENRNENNNDELNGDR